MLVRVPLDSLLAVSLLYFCLGGVLANIEDGVVVLALGLLEFELRVLELLPEAGGLGVDLLDPVVLSNGLVKPVKT